MRSSAEHDTIAPSPAVEDDRKAIYGESML